VLIRIFAAFLSICMLMTSAPISGVAEELNGLFDEIKIEFENLVDNEIKDTDEELSSEADDYLVAEQASGNWTDYASAAVTESNGIYDIYNAAQLAWVAKQSMGGTSDTTYGFSGKTIRLRANIDLSAHYWVPIGGYKSDLTYSTNYSFDGSFNGNGYIISGLIIPANTEFKNVGLFGYAKGGTFSNVGLKNVSVTSSYSSTSTSNGTGALIGYGNGVTIKNCYVRGGTVSASAMLNAGGILGTAATSNTQIYWCYTKGMTVNNSKSYSNTACGGIVGYINNSSAAIRYSYFVGTLKCSNTTADKYMGGIVGRNGDTGVEFLNCYTLSPYSVYGAGSSVPTANTSAQVTAANLKTYGYNKSAATSTLNAGGTYFYFDYNNVNGGYPVLASEYTFNSLLNLINTAKSRYDSRTSYYTAYSAINKLEPALFTTLNNAIKDADTFLAGSPTTAGMSTHTTAINNALNALATANTKYATATYKPKVSLTTPRTLSAPNNAFASEAITFTTDYELYNRSVTATHGATLTYSTMTTSGSGSDKKYTYTYLLGGTYTGSGSAVITFTAKGTANGQTVSVNSTSTVIASPVTDDALTFKFHLGYKVENSWGSITASPVLQYTLSVYGLHEVSTTEPYSWSNFVTGDDALLDVNFGDRSKDYYGKFYYDKNSSNTVGAEFGSTTLSTVRFNIYNPSNLMGEDGIPSAKFVTVKADYEDYMLPDPNSDVRLFDLLAMKTPDSIEFGATTAPYAPANSNGIDPVLYTVRGYAETSSAYGAISGKFGFTITYEWVDSTKLWNIYKSENSLNRFAYADLYNEADSAAWSEYVAAFDNATIVLAGGHSQADIEAAADVLADAVVNLKTKVIYDKNTGSGTCVGYEYLKIYSDLSATGNQIQAPTYMYNDAALTNYSGLTKTGYVCTGWSTDETATQGSQFLTMTPEAEKAPVTVYAAWAPVNYTVVYNVNRPEGVSTSVGTVANQSCVYDIEYTYSANSYVITNYKFAGWNTKQDGSGTTTKPGDKFKNLTTKSGIVNLYAVWEMDAVNILFNINLPDGVSATTSGLTANQSEAFVIGSSVSLAPYMMDAVGYKHVGWATQNAASTPTYTDTLTVPQTPLTLYAIWQKKSVAVNYALNGGELLAGEYTENNEVVVYGNTIDLPTKDEIYRSGYTLTGWRCSLDNKFYTDSYTVPDTSLTSVTFTAEWSYRIMTYTLHDNNAELEDVTRTISGTYTNALDKTLFTNPSTTDVVNGYSFAGWYVKDGVGYKPYAIPSTFPADDIDLYAGWQMTELSEIMASVPSDINTVVNGNPYFYYPKDEKEAVLNALKDAEEIYGTTGILCDSTQLRISNLTTENLKIALTVLKYNPADYTQVDIYRGYYEEIIAGSHSWPDDQGVMHNEISEKCFTTETFAEFKAAYDSVLESATIVQQPMVDGWAAALKEAYEALELKPGDYTELHKYYEICYELNGNATEEFNDESDGNKYYSDGWTDFFEVVWFVAKAECEEGRDMFYQDVINEYTLILEETYNMMQLRAPDFSAFTEELETAANNINAQTNIYDSTYRDLVLEALMTVIAAQNNGELSLKNDQPYVDRIIKTLKTLIDNPAYRTYTITFHYNGEYASDVIGSTTLPCNESISQAAPFEDPEREGFAFIGWYTTPEDTEDEIGRKIDFTTTTELMGTADRDIYARWEMTADGFVFEVTGTNATINLAYYENELKNVGTEYIDDNVLRGTPVILKAEATADGAEFLYWADGNGRIVSRNAEYNFVLVADAKLEAVYSEGIERESYKVIFVDGVTNKVISIVETQADTSAEAPALIDHVGYKFTGYSTSLQITKDTVIYAEYEKASESYTVTVTNGKGTLEPTGEYGYNTKVTVSLKESEIPEGKYFAGWTLDGGNTIVSYEMTYTFYVYGDTEVEALFADVKTEKSSTVTIAVTDKTETSVAFMVSREIAEDEFFLSSGLLITKDEANATEEALTLDNESENEAIRNFTTLRNEKVGQYKLTVSSSTPGTEYYARGYIVFRDADGKIAVKYTEVVKVTL